MNSQQTTQLLIASILAFALFANISAPAVFATGGLDDEEEEEAIEQLQDAVEEIQSAVGAIELNLVPGANDITANCPPLATTNEEEAIVEENNITNNNNNETQEQEQQPQCPLAPSEPEPEQQPAEVPPETTVIPSIVQQNNTVGCSPVTEEPEVPAAVEPEEQNNQTSELEPIICPINGDLLGYTNTTSGEQLPISAVLEDEQNNGTIPFLPPIQLPTEEEEPEPVTTVPEQNSNQTVTEELPSCNVTQQAEQQPTITLQDEQPIASIEYEASCGCFVVDKSPEEVQ